MPSAVPLVVVVWFVMGALGLLVVGIQNYRRRNDTPGGNGGDIVMLQNDKNLSFKPGQGGAHRMVQMRGKPGQIIFKTADGTELIRANDCGVWIRGISVERPEETAALFAAMQEFFGSADVELGKGKASGTDANIS